MKYSVDVKALKDALDLLMSIVERKNTIPVLATIRFNAEGNKLSLTGTDLDHYLTVEIDAEVARSGCVCLSARRVLEIVNTIGSGVLDIDVEDSTAHVSQGALSYKLWTTSPDAFPEVPAFGSVSITAPSVKLRELIRHTIFSITHEEGRYTLSGAKVLIGKKGATFITTDGHRLSLATVKEIISANSVDALVPLRVLKLLADLSRLAETVALGFNEDRMYVQIGTVQLNARLLRGQFPDWKKVLPKSFARTVEIDSDQFNKALTQVMITADARSHYLRLAIADSTAELTAQDSDECSAATSIPITANGDPITLAFNGKYLREVVSIRKGVVELAINAADSQVGIMLLGDSILDDYQHVLMPCR